MSLSVPSSPLRSTHQRNTSASGLLSNLVANSPLSSLFSPKINYLPVPEDTTYNGESSKSVHGEMNIHRVELKVGGMTVRPFSRIKRVVQADEQCGACVAAIEGQLTKMPGITSVQISLLAERGVVEYDGDYVNEYGEAWTDKKIADEIEDVGFDAEIVEKSEIAAVELRVYGYVGSCRDDLG